MKTLWFSLIGAVLLAGCSKDPAAVGPTLFRTDYFPVSAGRYWVYDVDSLFRNDFTGKTDTFHFQLKEYIDTVFADGDGKPSGRLERYLRSRAQDPWVLRQVWSLRKNGDRAEKLEDNQRIIKIQFPLFSNKIWNGNALNAMGPQNYTAVRFWQQYRLGAIEFDSTIQVVSLADTTLVALSYEEERYSKGVGLIGKTVIRLQDRNPQVNPALPVIQRANYGTLCTWSLLEFGQ
jgi:hypothetical protein